MLTKRPPPCFAHALLIFPETDYFTPEYYFENYSVPEERFNSYRDKDEIFPQAIYDIACN